MPSCMTDGQVPQVVANIGDFRIAAKLQLTEGWRTKEKHDVNWTTRLRALEIEVSPGSRRFASRRDRHARRKAGFDGPFRTDFRCSLRKL